jgi:hypothetical protein
MSRKRYTMEQIIGLLREVDIKVSQGKFTLMNPCFLSYEITPPLTSIGPIGRLSGRPLDGQHRI